MPTGTPSCSDFNVRLAGKKNRVMGLVHACYTNDANDSLWGPICADRIGSWTISSAMTVCKQLGLPTTSKHKSLPKYSHLFVLFVTQLHCLYSMKMYLVHIHINLIVNHQILLVNVICMKRSLSAHK